MDSKASSSLIFLVLFAIFSSTSMAFNITKLLSNYPGFSTFNTLLSKTGLAEQINSRQTITVLAVGNDAIGVLSGKPLDLTKRILSPHVILDYYDEAKLKKLQKKSSILTTLYQTTGIANDQQGFVNVTRTNDGIMFGSAAKGSPLTASLEGVVVTQPYNISVLEVSGVIQTPGIEYMSPPPPGGANKNKKASTPAPAPAETPVMSPAEGPAPVADGPVADDEAPTEAPIKAPTPVADGPEADSPVNSPPEPNSPAAADADTPDAAPPSLSGSSRMQQVRGGVAAVIGLAACIMGF